MIRTWTKWFEKALFKSEKLVCMYDLYYRNIVKKEIDVAKIKNTDKVLIVGGEAVPCTAINIATQTNALIDVIDLDKEAVDKSRKLIDRLNLSSQIKIYLKDAKEIDVNKYDVIHVALQVSPKEEVLNNIWEKSKYGTRVLIRQPKKSLKRFYSNISDDFLNKTQMNFEINNDNTGLNTLDNLLLIVKE